MIDVKTGHLVLDEQHTVTPQTSLATLEQWQLGTSQETRQMGNNYQWMTIKNLQIDALYFNISFLFKDTRMAEVTFTFQDEPYATTPSWDSWSKEIEENNLLRFKEWLDQQLGEVRALEWGKVEALYDSKSAASSIKLSYAFV